MNSNDMPTPLSEIQNIAADATGAVTRLLTEYERAVKLITLKNMAIEDLNHQLEAQTEFANKLAAIPGVNCNEEPEQETTARRPARLKDPEPSDLNTDITQHQVGNLFGAGE